MGFVANFIRFPGV